jgi:serine/threonine-protein kinase
MAIPIGTQLGPYEIMAAIGAGGMGEVYQARDTRLNRTVAVKVSAERFSERFEREAKLIASLNHPNICSLFDVGPNFLVMEFVEGPTLADRIAEGPIPLEESLHIAMQIAQALESAHDKGIIHRDLKPGNIKIKPDGTVKVLDFGLAKAVEGSTANETASNSPTMSMAATQAGIVLGTAAYMSPEQARGKPVDKRADIWAFGAVLYEMITGRQLFRGDDITETLASVIMKEPDLQPVPPKIRRVLSRCLEKDPRNRLRDISGVALLLEDQPSAVSSNGRLPHTPWFWPAATLFAIVVAAVLGFALYRVRPEAPASKPLIRLNVDLGSSVTFSFNTSITGSNLILSPDGRRLVYISQGHLYTMLLDGSPATEIPGTEGTYSAFFSPDGRWLAFQSGAKIKKVAVDGGTIGILPLSDSISRGGAWSEDGSIIVTLSGTGGLFRIPEGGGSPTALTQLAEGETTHRWPQSLPGSRAVVYTANNSVTGFDAASIKIRSLDGSTKTIQRGGTYGRIIHTPRGHNYLIYVSRNTLFAEPFDMDRLEVTGNPVPVVNGIGTAQSGAAQMDVSNDGTLVYGGLTGGGLLSLQWMDAAGNLQPLVPKPAVYGRPSLSPQADQVAVEINGSTTADIWIYETRRDYMRRLTFGGSNQMPVWTPDGRYIVYQDEGGLSSVRSNGGVPQPLLRSKNLQFPWSFMPDGKRLAYLEAAQTGYDLWTVPLEIDPATGIRAGKPEPFLTSSADERSPSFSPDGRWLAYSSNEGGSFELYVRSFPDKGSKWQVSNGGGSYPMWSRTAHELFFETPDAHVMVAPYSVTNDSFVAEKPRLWSPKALVNMVNNVKNVELAPDGKRVVALMPVATPEDPSTQNHVTFLLNFFDELERRVPVRK